MRFRADAKRLWLLASAAALYVLVASPPARQKTLRKLLRKVLDGLVVAVPDATKAF
jgi:hypothetical protein